MRSYLGRRTPAASLTRGGLPSATRPPVAHADDHTTGNTPDPVQVQKGSLVRPGRC